MVNKLYFFTSILFFLSSACFGQHDPSSQKLFAADTMKYEYNGVGAVHTFDIHFKGFAFLDDHEYDALIPLRKTISGTRTAIDVGLNIDSSNHFVVGTNALHEFGGGPYFVQLDPVAYFKYNAKNWLFFAGEFPRQDLLTQYPRALLNDTLQYYRPNVQGLLLRNKSKYGYETGWIDWISRQTPTNRNQFMAGELGTIIPDPGHAFYIAHYFLFEHNAGSKSDTAAEIQDSGGAQIRLGLDFSHCTLFDSLKFEVGGMGTAHRTRSQYQFQVSKGFVASVYISHKRFSLFDDFYRGQPYYLTFADPFYIKPIYNRLDFIYTAFLGKYLKGQFILGLHQSPARLTDSQPGFKIVYDLGRQTLFRFKSKPNSFNE
jgi:hypothetical protein